MTWRGVYLITPDDPDGDRLLERVSAVLPAGPALLQYRNKQADAAQRRDQAGRLQDLCERAGVPLIINDDWRLAEAIGAAGVHLGEDDGDLATVRRQCPRLILGASCYDSLERAQQAREAGADYLAFGAFFPTQTKTTTRRARPDLLAAAEVLARPRVAIGGITADNAPALIAAGADMVAVVGSVFSAPDPLGAARRLAALFPSLAADGAIPDPATPLA